MLNSVNQVEFSVPLLTSFDSKSSTPDGMQSVVVVSIALALVHTLNFFCSSSVALASNSFDAPLVAPNRTRSSIKYMRDDIVEMSLFTVSIDRKRISSFSDLSNSLDLSRVVVIKRGTVGKSFRLSNFTRFSF